MRRDWAWRSHFPYLLQEEVAADGSPCWIALNREYKPIGFDERIWANYADSPIGIRPVKSYQKRWSRFLSMLESHDGCRHWFYSDTTAPHRGFKKNQDRYLALLQAFGEIPLRFVALKRKPAPVVPLRRIK